MTPSREQMIPSLEYLMFSPVWFFHFPRCLQPFPRACELLPRDFETFRGGEDCLPRVNGMSPIKFVVPPRVLAESFLHRKRNKLIFHHKKLEFTF